MENKKFAEFSEREVNNIRSDAMTAIDALNSIVAECNSSYVSGKYLREKAEKSLWCVQYIASVVREGGKK